MLSFKEFLEEAKRKPKEPDWPDADYASGFSQLRDKQAYLTLKPDQFRLQLFVPKRRDPDKEKQRASERRYYAARAEVDAEEKAKLKEEKAPILTSFRESPPGDNKPSGAFWTSSAIKTANGYTSDWYRYVRNNFREWQTDYGYLFEIQPNALVYSSLHLDQFYDWAETHNKGSKPVPAWADREYGSSRMRTNFPWDMMARHFDGVYHSGSSYGSDSFTYGWDVESTAWFNTGVLKYKGAVKLDQFGDEDE